MREELIGRLVAHRTLGTMPRAELEWIAEHGELRRFEAGARLVTPGQVMSDMFIMLEGRLAVYIDRGGGVVRAVDFRTGDVGGLLPYSRMAKSPGTAVAEEDLTVIALTRERVEALARECPVTTATLVHVLIDRARLYTTDDLHEARTIALGNLASGLAHELNNPG